MKLGYALRVQALQLSKLYLMSDAMTLQGLLKLAELYAAAAGYRSGTETEAGYSLICGGTTGGLESEIKAGHSLVRGGTESGLEDLEVSLL